jgi:tetratricopeptide (TPR) repeat protein
MTIGTDADKSGSNQGTVVFSGQLNEQRPLQAVLQNVMRNQNVEHGVLRVLSKDVRGHIGIASGAIITGAHVTSTSEFGQQGLRKLLGATRGMFAFLALSEQQPELRQGLNIRIQDVVSAAEATSDFRASLEQAVDKLLANSSMPQAQVQIDMSQAAQSALVRDTEEAFASYMAWGDVGGQSLGTNLATTLSGIAPMKPAAGQKVEIERLHIPSDDENTAAAAQQAREMPPPIVLSPELGINTGGWKQQTASGGWPQAQPQTASGGWPQAQPPQPAPQPANQQHNAMPAGNPAAFVPTPPANPPASNPNNYNRGALDAIPTPRAKGDGQQPAAPAGSSPAEKPPEQANEQRPTGKLRARPKKEKPPANPKRRKKDKLDAKELKEAAEQAEENQPVKQIYLPPPVQQEVGIGKEVYIGGAVGIVLLLLLAHQSFNALSYSGNMQDGLDALKHGKNDIAQVDFSSVISSNPGVADGYFYRAIAELRLGNHTGAMNDFNKAIELNPKNSLAYVARASLHNKMKEYEAAIEDCNNAIGVNEKCYDALKVRAIAYNRLGQYNQAIEDAKLFLGAYTKEDKSRAEVLANRAYSWFKKKSFDDALRDYTEAIRIDKKNGIYYASRAVVYKQVHAWNQAIDDCNAASLLLPGDASIYKIRGACYSYLGQSESSLKDLDFMCKMNPTIENHRMRGNARLHVHDYQGALEDFEWVLGAKPHDKEARTKYEQARLGLQSTAKMTGAVAEQLADNTKKVEVKLNLPEPELVKKGFELMQHGDTDQAEPVLAAAVKANPADTLARRYLAYAMVQAGHSESAIAVFNALGKMVPLTSSDQMMYAKALEYNKDHDKAIGVYANLVASDPANDQARQALIKALIANGEKERAAKAAKEGMQLSPKANALYAELLKQAEAK